MSADTSDGGTGAGAEAHLAPPAPGGGAGVAATVVGSAADTEVALDGAFTPALLAALKAHPGASIDEVLQQVSAASLAWGPSPGGGLQHPTIVQYGRIAEATPEPRAPRAPTPRAVLVANEDYVHLGDLGTPKAEAGAMQRELTSRGYDASVHHDRSAADMAALWSALVGAATPGDDLVAYFGGHGTPEGLAGIQHGLPPLPPDLFGNAQVAGVVSSATDKGAHIRFVMDSCHSGAATQVIREERQNKLAAAAGPAGDAWRIAAMTGLRQARQRLLAILAERDATVHRLDAPEPAGADAGVSSAPRHLQAAGRDVVAGQLKTAFQRAVDRMWAEYVPLLEAVKQLARHAEAPPPIDNYGTLGAQINYLDDLWNAVSQPVETAIAKTAATPAAR